MNKSDIVDKPAFNIGIRKSVPCSKFKYFSTNNLSIGFNSSCQD